MGWLKEFSNNLAFRRWVSSANELCMLHPFPTPDEVDADIFEISSDEWKALIADVINQAQDARENLLKHYRDDVYTNKICAESSYAAAIHQWLKDIRPR